MQHCITISSGVLNTIPACDR